MAELRLTYLYPYHMNLYGDTGNIICLKKRCEERSIQIKITPIHPGDQVKEGSTDLYFFGGGQDDQQLHIAQHLESLKQVINFDINNGVSALCICGGYQLFGKFFKTKDGKVLKGIEIFNCETYGSNHRMIGNSIVKINEALYSSISNIYPQAPKTLVGFENHSGETRLIDVDSLGNNICGYGNNYTDRREGCVFKNAIGTYLHGALLPKNPHLADYLIVQALKNRYKESFNLTTLDDFIALNAHNQIIRRFSPN